LAVSYLYPSKSFSNLPIAGVKNIKYPK